MIRSNKKGKQQQKQTKKKQISETVNLYQRIISIFLGSWLLFFFLVFPTNDYLHSPFLSFTSSYSRTVQTRRWFIVSCTVQTAQGLLTSTFMFSYAPIRSPKHSSTFIKCNTIACVIKRENIHYAAIDSHLHVLNRCPWNTAKVD